jgi:hypothetical protein
MTATKDEIDRAYAIIEEVMGDPEHLLYTALDIESVCGWRIHDDAPKCGAAVRKACFLFATDEHGQVHAVTYCDHHADCMTEAAASRRRKN